MESLALRPNFGSEKAVLRLARLRRRVRNICRGFLHKISVELAKARPVLVVEGLNIRDPGRDGILSRSIQDAGCGAFERT